MDPRTPVLVGVAQHTAATTPNEPVEMMAAVAANEPGCLLYELSRSDDPQTYFFMERYVDADAVAAHGSTDHMKAFGAKIGGCLAGRPEIVRGAPVVED